MQTYYVAWWNLENLYDVNGTLPPERPEWLQKKLKSELKGWTAAVLDTKIKQLATIIKQMNQGSGPDLLGVCEVENKPVLEKLVLALASLNRNYQIVHHNMPDGRGIDVAFIYDPQKFTAAESFSHTIQKRSGTRDLFQVNLATTKGNRLIVIGNHWPSRSAGRWESEPYRIMAGETLSYFIERIPEKTGDPDVSILVMGDFNDEPFDRSITDYALGTRIKSKVTRAKSPRLYNVMWGILGSRQGTYYYDGNPNVLDQFMVPKGMLVEDAKLKVKLDSVVVERSTMTKKKSEIPRKFGRPSSKTDYDPEGFSDHFPISVLIDEK